MAIEFGRTRVPHGLAPGITCLAFCLALAGCEPVREDRTIEFSAEGESVGFQHGDEGVFVADKSGGGLKKIFGPDAGVLASSTPLWAPAGRQLVFTTARAAEGETAGATRAQVQLRGLLAVEPDPAGGLFVEAPVVYTCWLRDEATGEPPLKLFDAKCDHVGYVAASLAVRWHPKGDRILYVDSVATGRASLFAFDLKTKAAQRIFPHDAPALVFDWSPDGAAPRLRAREPGPGKRSRWALDRRARCRRGGVVARAGLERARASGAEVNVGAAPRIAPGLDERRRDICFRHEFGRGN